MPTDDQGAVYENAADDRYPAVAAAATAQLPLVFGPVRETGPSLWRG